MTRKLEAKLDLFAKLNPEIQIRLLLGQLLVIIGQFLPLKSVLILYSGSVPEFFPNSLANLGTEVNAVLLLLAGGVVSLTGLVILRRTQVREDSIGNYHLFPTLIVLSLLLSPLMTALVATYLMIFITLSLKGARSEGKPVSLSEISEISSGVARRSIWVTSSAAFISLLVWLPPVGLIGVLASAVLLNRCQRELKWFLGRLHRANVGIFS